MVLGMDDASIDGFHLTRLWLPDHDLLVRLEEYDREAFGAAGLRTYDLAVVAQAGALFLALTGDEIVGSCQLLRMFDEPSFLYVVGFYLRPAWQGRGLGRRLLGHVARESIALGVAGLVLTVAPDNIRARNLYKSAGFVEEDFIPHFYGEGEDRHVLRWCFPKGGLPGGV